MPGILEAISNGFGFLKELFSFQRQKLELKNSPEMRDAAERAKEQERVDKVNKTTKDGDLDAIRKDLSILAALLIPLVLVAGGCTATITPKHVETTQIGFDGTNVNAGLIGQAEDGRYIITETLRKKYNALVAIYPKGIDFHPFLIPLTTDSGLTVRRMESGVQTWYMDQEHMAAFRLMNAWLKEGKKPR